MRLLTGPAGSGKTSIILDRFREGAHQGRSDLRLLVPTATLTQHLQNRMARDGLVFRRSLIQTLSGFIETWVQDIPAVPREVLYLIVEEVARRVNRPEFTRVVQMPGFCAALARTIEEFSSAGCDSGRLASALPDTPLGPAFLAVYREVDCELERRGLSLRARRLEQAAERIAKQGLGGVREVLMDGFHALPDPELAVIEAMGRHAELTLTLGDGSLAARLARIGFQEERAGGSRPSPTLQLVRAPSIEREVEEIARRVLEESVRRPFRDIGIVVRPADAYIPLLRSTLERFGIPARFYFDSELEHHPVIRYLEGILEAMLSGWEHVKTLAVLRLAPRFADSDVLDRFDFAVREQIPNAGLGDLKSLLVEIPGHDKLLHKLESFTAFEEWRSFLLTPKDWARHLGALRGVFRPAEPPGASHELALQWRSQAAVLDLFEKALDEAAAALQPDRQMPLAAFWRAVKSVLRLKPLRLEDRRRNVVHVLSAHEARQWVLPVVFVCGMVEKQFPQFHPQNPFLPDAARCRLNQAGIRVRTAEEFEREEQALFDSAISRATVLTVLTYPEFDARGDRNLPSLYLETLRLETEESHPVRPQPRSLELPPEPVLIRDADGLVELRRRTGKVAPSSLESFLQCPFQHFAQRILRLKPAPPRPEDRLDFLAQGIIVHDVLKIWWKDGEDIETVFEQVFAEVAAERGIRTSYHTERLRNAMIADLRAFAADGRWPRNGYQSRTEEEFSFPLDESVNAFGKIDRVDIGADGRAYIFDYKYSAKQRTKNRRDDPNLLQAPLYLLAAEKKFGARPAGMFYIGLKKEIVYVGWSEDRLLESEALPADWAEQARDRTLAIVEEIRSGRIEPRPYDVDNCRFCDFRDACRVQAGAVAAAGEGA
jgi:ATP-dependent helicase/DNAse subunit B